MGLILLKIQYILIPVYLSLMSQPFSVKYLRESSMSSISSSLTLKISKVNMDSLSEAQVTFLDYLIFSVSKIQNQNTDQERLQFIHYNKRQQGAMQKKEYKLSSYRYINLLIYILASFVNSIPAQAFSSISNIIQTQFNYRPLIITLNTLFFPLLHPIMAFPANWIIDKYGMRIACSIGAVILVIGVWLRTLIEYQRPAWCLVGSGFAAIGNVFILNTPSVIATNWFNTSSVPKIITINVLMTLVSVSLGASLPGLLVKKSANISDVKEFFRNEAIIVTIPFILLIIFLRNKPEDPPSRAAQMRKNIKKKPYIETIKSLIKNKEYIKIVLAMMFSYGSMIGYFAILDQCLKHLGYEYPDKVTSFTILSIMSSGIVSTLFFSYCIKRTLKYKMIISISVGGTVVTFTLLQILYFQIIDEAWVLIMGGICLGTFMIPISSLFTAYSSQAIFPEGQGSATGYLFAASQTFGFLSGLILISILQQETEFKVHAVMLVSAIFFIISFIVNLTTKQSLRRTDFERDSERSSLLSQE